MSVDEDSELRELVAQTLETNGVLGRIRAELRASVFMALEEQDSVKNKAAFVNQELRSFLTTKDGQLAISLVREFLQFFKLDYTLAVFDPESGYNDQFLGRSSLINQLNFAESSVDAGRPVISEVLKQCQSSTSSLVESLSVEQISEARRKFNEYDKDKSGKIERNELQLLFADVFPNVNRNMLDRYVNDEFRVSDKDFSNAIEFHEFLSMFRRMFVLCKSSLSKNVVDIIPPKTETEETKSAEKLSKPTNGLKKNKASNNMKELDRGGASDEDSFASSHDDLSLPDNKPGGGGGGGGGSFTSFGKSDFGSKASSEKPKTTGSGMSSLADLPDLGFKTIDKKTDNAKNDLEVIDLGGDFGDYDDDFLESNISPVGPTPRSARSDRNANSAFDEVVEEEIEEELLRSVASSNDDLTTDKTISVAEPTGAGDYFEDVLH